MVKKIRELLNPFNFFRLGAIWLQVFLKTRQYEKFIQEHYYHNTLFARVDQKLKDLYKMINPYHIVRDYVLEKGIGDPYSYGETPLQVYEEVGKKLKLSSNNLFIELGSGRGRGSFFMSSFFKARIVGIEEIPLFINLASLIKEEFSLSVDFLQGDFLSYNIPEKAIIYLYGLCLEEEDLRSLAIKFKKSACRVVTVSFPIKDYCDSFNIKEFFEASFPWGETTVYLCD